MNSAAFSSTTAETGTKQTKKRKKKRAAKAIPLVKGATAASLAKKRQAESSSTLSRSRRRKRSREAAANNSTNSNTKKKEFFSSTAESLAVISKFHTLNKRLEQNERDESISETERQRIAQEIKTEQEAMGGLDRYQKASMYGAKSSKFVCADWVVPRLQQQRKSSHGKLRILDVGAIDNQYHGKGYDDWLDAVPIDLHGGQHESVLQVDFFDYAHAYCSGRDLSAEQHLPSSTTTKPTPQQPTPQPFDAIVMSLVLNFQGDPRKRGDMLALAADPRLLKVQTGGMLFVALPSASLDNSRYCDLDRFVQVVTNPRFGLELVETKTSAKLVLLAFERTTSPPQQNPRSCYHVATQTFDYGDHEMKRLPAKPGTKRNNFAVILKSSRNRT